ncbi:hypothetical protein [Atlantibacter hermannii]|uniref:hypothetical protein n=1 Tax=Atlantibacter hermannii TaxID=565 RepID=UPI00358DA218
MAFVEARAIHIMPDGFIMIRSHTFIKMTLVQQQTTLHIKGNTGAGKPNSSAPCVAVKVVLTLPDRTISFTTLRGTLGVPFLMGDSS